MNKEEKEQWLYETYQYTSNFDFSRLDKYEEANDDICIDDLILDYTMLYEFHKEEIERLNNIIKNQQEDIEEYNDKLNEVVKERNKYLHIINELEKYINKTKLEEFEKEYGRRYGKTFTQAEVIICNMILNKLQELKGDDK